jgi:hypothetical protein
VCSLHAGVRNHLRLRRSEASQNLVLSSGEPRQAIISPGAMCPPEHFLPFPNRHAWRHDGGFRQEAPLAPLPDGGLGIPKPIRDFPHPHGVSQPRHFESMGSQLGAHGVGRLGPVSRHSAVVRVDTPRRATQYTLGNFRLPARRPFQRRNPESCEPPMEREEKQHDFGCFQYHFRLC